LEHTGRGVIRRGDIAWQGGWSRIAREYGPFDWAFLPINGAIATDRGAEPSGLPTTLTPKQACAAARILQASKLCPIHYRTFNNPPHYVEQPNLLDALAQAAREEKVDV